MKTRRRRRTGKEQDGEETARYKQGREEENESGMVQKKNEEEGLKRL
jgi:hypothetical protein